MSGVEMLLLAAKLTEEQVNKAAHALGWPDLRNIDRPRGRTRWSNPYRNRYAGDAEDEDWRDLEHEGLAERMKLFDGTTIWSVTPLGCKVVRLRLTAARKLCANK